MSLLYLRYVYQSVSESQSFTH